MQLAGTGFPQLCNNRFPRGLDQCPVPDFVVVNFPEYTGAALLLKLPRTWVPIPAEQIAHQNIKSLTRINIPLRLAWALTFHKCQGITAIEGTIISFLGCHMTSPVSKVGLPFVGWTRATSWAKVAFQALPSWSNFWLFGRPANSTFGRTLKPVPILSTRPFYIIWARRTPSKYWTTKII